LKRLLVSLFPLIRPTHILLAGDFQPSLLSLEPEHTLLSLDLASPTHVLSRDRPQSTDHGRTTRSTPSRQTTPIWPRRSSTASDSRRTITSRSEYGRSSRRGWRMSVCGALGGCMMVSRIRLLLMGCVLFCLALLSCGVPSWPFHSYFIPSHPVLSQSISCYPVVSIRIPSYPFLS
jgi:hypothetical protein